MEKKLGFIGLGKMGNAMVLHMLEEGIAVVAYNRTKEKVDEIAKDGAIPSYTLQEFVDKSRDTSGRAIIWLMVKAGEVVDEVIFGNEHQEGLVTYLHQGDILIDGGNSYYQDTQRRAKQLQEKGIQLFDCGTSGGVYGARHGACLMIGGDKEGFTNIKWIFTSVAQANGYGYMGNTGSGHYVKMVHNAIEYGMMQSIAEGLDLLENGAMESLGNALQLENVLNVWNHGSIVESYLTKVTQDAIQKDPHLEHIGDRVDDNGEGSWTILEAIKTKIPFLTVCYALFMRYTTRKDESFAMKIVAAQRNEFGGHDVERK